VAGEANIGVIIPALDEAASIGRVLDAIPATAREIVVVDNGSSDGTAEGARRHGARVVVQTQRGYGAACLRGIEALGDMDIVVFLDADFSDRPEEMDALVAPIAAGEVDFVVGSRVRGRAEAGSLTIPQRFGNALACTLLRILFGVTWTDLGPFRAIRRDALVRLAMDDRGYGWTVQMQARAARVGVRSVEVPVSYRRRIGRSKISGTVRGTFAAGSKILSTIFFEAWGRRRTPAVADERLVVMARDAVAGRTKTRLMPLLGGEGACRLAAELLRCTLGTARGVGRERRADVEVRIAGLGPDGPARALARGLGLRDQGPGDLGARMRRAVVTALAEGARRVVLIGTDCPDLTPAYVGAAFEALARSDLVLGPANDGGYVLIGMRADHAALFRDVAWGGPDVLATTRAKASALGLTTACLGALSDIDHPEDLGAWARAKQEQEDGSAAPWLSVIVPTLNERDELAATLFGVGREAGVEVIVSDGGSTDGTLEIARLFGAEVVCGPASRGRQLNAGAARARGGTLLFLHADTRLPPGYGDVIRRVLAQRHTSAGAFTLAIEGAAPGLRLVEATVALRSRRLGRPYGDQAMFLSATTFRAAGGFPDVPYMEDYVLLARLRPFGRVRIAHAAVRTSGRQWKRRGIVRTTLHHQKRILRHHLGGGGPPSGAPRGRARA